MYTHSLDPVLFDLGFLVIRWYSLAYIFGIPEVAMKREVEKYKILIEQLIAEKS